jgi:TonB-linked SusC/RagA family outer membrane protein
MEKKRNFHGQSLWESKLIRIMKLTVFLMLISLMGVFASETYSQTTRLTLNANKISLEDFLVKIENQSEFRFFYTGKINVEQEVSGEFKNKKIFEVLDEIKEEAGFQYEVLGRQIILSPNNAEGAIKSIQQQNSVLGKVSDTSNQPLPGVTVIVKGTTTGTVTNADGNYTISNIPENTTLQFSFVGMLTQEVEVDGQATIDITLVTDAIGIEEVVAIGYGTQRKKLSTGASIRLEGDALSSRSQVNAVRAMQGMTPGVNITAVSGQPGAASKIIIRGMGTVGDFSPLYIVDGVQTSNIDYLSPSNIESIDILKDAASAAIYGARAANGVILITTQSGKLGKGQVTFDAYYGLQSLGKRPEVLNAQEYAMLMNEKYTNSGKAPFFVGDKMDQVITMGEGTDWIDEMFEENVPTQDYNLGFSGGNEQSIYSMGLSFTQQGGIAGGEDVNNMKRYSLRINSEHNVIKKILKVGENLTVSRIDTKGLDMGGKGNHVWNAVQMPPILPMYDDDGNYYSNRGLLYEFGGGQYSNPVALMMFDTQLLTENAKLVGNFFAELSPIENLKIRSTVGIDYGNARTRRYYPKYPDLGPYNNQSTRPFDQADQNSVEALGMMWTNTASYKLNIDKHMFDVLIGMEAVQQKINYLSASNKNLTFNDLEHAYISNALGKNNEGTMSMSGYPAEHKLLSYFGRINYNLNDKYLLNFILRSDGSSNFDSDYRRGYFPSISAGWLMTNESFMENTNKWLSSLKIRGSWGQNGNESIPAFYYLSPVATGYNYPIGPNDDATGLLHTGAALSRMSNPTLKWEVSEQLDFGFDAALFNNNFEVTLDLYKKSTNGWLLNPPVSPTIGLAAPYINGGNVINKGIELALTYHNKVNDFEYSINVNGAYNNNSVTEVPNDIIHGPGGGLTDNNTEYYRTQTGYPLGYFWMLETDGLFQNQDAVNTYAKDGKKIQPNALPGDLKYVDQNNDGVINDEDKVNVGDAFPDYNFGLNLNFGYKGFGLMITGYGAADVQVVQAYTNAARYFPNYTTEALGRWHGEGTSNHYPRLDVNGINWTINSDIYVYEADFFKINNITLSYDFSRSGSIKPVSQAKVYVTLMNGITFTKYNDFDPEVGRGQSSYMMGHATGFVPSPRTILLGVNFKL